MQSVPDAGDHNASLDGAMTGSHNKTVLGASPNSNSNGANPSSSFQFFVQAKRQINNLYNEVNEYIHGSSRFLGASCSSGDIKIVSDEERIKVEEYVRKVEGIREVLQRDHMKVVFFGRTSNGKSTAINALLGDRILPTGIGHTTSCFLQVSPTTRNLFIYIPKPKAFNVYFSIS